LAPYVISRGLEGIDARIGNNFTLRGKHRGQIEEQVKTIVKGSMDEALKRIIPEVPFAVEIRMALAWG